MKLLNLTQGSDEWLAARLSHFCASEAPVIMGESPYMTRKQLLDLKKGWQANPGDSFKQKLWQRGHEHEAQAREHIEFDMMLDIPPAVGSIMVDGIDTAILASFDGYAEGRMSWEHKDWNEKLAENVRNNVIEPLYYWQLEHQCLVSGMDMVTLTVSDGTMNKRVSMNYESVPERRQQLIDAWKVFEQDLASHTVEAKTSVEVEAKAEQLPAIVVKCENGLITSNLQDVIAQVKELANYEKSRDLETDQDFADKDQLNKLVKKARDHLKERVKAVQDEFVEFSEFQALASELDGVLQKLQSDGEKKVTAEKENRKQAVIIHAEAHLNDYCQNMYEQIKPLNAGMINFSAKYPDFKAAIKGKRNLDSIQSAIDDAAAAYKVELGPEIERVAENLLWLNDNANDHRFLFSDVETFINQEAMPFQAICKQLISEYEQAEKAKAEAPQPADPEPEAVKTAALEVEASDPAPASSRASIVECPEDEVIRFNDGKTFKFPDLSGDGAFTAVEKMQQLCRNIINAYKDK